MGIGNLALPPVIESLIDSYGWRVALRCVAVAIFCASMFAASLLRRRITVVRKFEFGSVIQDRRFQVPFSFFFFVCVFLFSLLDFLFFLLNILLYVLYFPFHPFLVNTILLSTVVDLCDGPLRELWAYGTFLSYCGLC